MINLIISRNGHLEGVSIVPTRDVHNPYFLFGAECTKENQIALQTHIDRAKDIYATCMSNSSPKEFGGTIPEYTVRTLLLWLEIHFSTAISYPEVGCIPRIQSLLMCLVVAINETLEDEHKLTVFTTSEYMVRMAQLIVANDILSTDQIQIGDMAADETPQNMVFTIPSDMEHEYTM